MVKRDIADIDELPTDEFGCAVFPDGMTEEDGLYVLPDGRYLPCGVYATSDGGSLIYEPSQLSFFGRMLSQLRDD